MTLNRASYVTLNRMTTDKMTCYLIICKSSLGNVGSWVNKALNFVTEWLQAWGSELTLWWEYNGIEKIPSFSPPFSPLRVYPGPQAYNNSVLKLSTLPTQLSPLSKWDKLAAIFCRKLAEWVSDIFFNFYIVKIHKIASNLKTTEAREEISTDLEPLEFHKSVGHVWLDIKTMKFYLIKLAEEF
jgi:hypothetical protein